ncbi:MAG TPA: hypothetical protein VHV51_20735 [Polyangiaceae bacterium]|jgi:hypothetical protein|nr:hypothetical protein [Polyangiaceae bacterium]
MSDAPRDQRAPELDELELELLDAAEEAELSEALRAAFAPHEIDPRVHERLLEAALEDPLAPPSAEELVESERLRRALDGAGEHADLALARALKAAHAPNAPKRAKLELAAGALKSPSRNVIFVRFGAAFGAVAAAALVLLSLHASRRPEAAEPANLLAAAPDLQTLAQSRSTAGLFANAASAGEPSTRIDRIASLRERELRENRYALWGVR